MANFKKLNEPAEVRLRVEKLTKDKLKIHAISKGISINDLCRRYLREGLQRDWRQPERQP
jgi:predicted HicB family RNase H-like nuclease